MRDPLFRPFTSLSSLQDSLFGRIRANFQQLFAPARILPSSANGAPLHLPRWNGYRRSRRAQTVSVLTHAMVIAALLVFATHPPGRKPNGLSPDRGVRGLLPVPRDVLKLLRGQTPSGGTGSGSGHDFLPPTQGNLPRISAIQLLKPTLPRNQNPELPVPPTILDASAPPVLPPVNNIGIPWMQERNNSSGRSTGNTIGDSQGGDSIGDTPGNLAGQGGEPGPYRPGFTSPTCMYCPDPQYTDEARQAKVQGRVTLRVLVNSEGRAAQIQILQGVGLGLDERAVQTVRGWKFVPAHDAVRHTVPAWVTIEVVYRLI